MVPVALLLREEFFAAELVSVDVLVGRLLQVLPESAALLVTSNHGQVHIEHGQHLSLDPLASLREAFAGGGRFHSLYPAGLRISWSPQRMPSETGRGCPHATA